MRDPAPWPGARVLRISAPVREGSRSTLFDDFPWGIFTVDLAREILPKGNGRGEWFPVRKLEPLQ